ncbi:MAG: hypothetical protein ACYDCO_02740 [Armatimonadota bacterium]
MAYQLYPGTEPVLLLDDHVVAETQGCRQTFHGAVKDPANPILTCTEPWEGKGPYTWGTRLLWNPDTGQYDFFYVGFRVEDNHYRWGLAVSPDGLAWEKPELNIESFDGNPARNMLTGGPHPEKAVRSVVRAPRPECPPAERYKAIRFTYDGELVSYSPDGRRWTEDPGNPVWYVPSDIIHAMWDPRRERFTTYYKIWEVTGETPDPAGGFRPVTAHFPTFDHRPAEDSLAEISGPMVTFHPEGAATVEETVLRLRAGEQGIDDGGGAPLTGAWHARRVQAWAESDDWRHWHGERVVLRQDERDRPDANIQYFFVLPYGAYYLGFLTMHDERGHFEQQLAFSRDGLAWSRPWRGNFIGLGAPGAFDSGMVLAPTDPIVTDTQLIFYYGGFDIKHYEPMSQPWSSAIGRATLRRDGFASWDSLPGETGVLLTQPLTVEGETLSVNADAQAGRLRVEVLNEAGQVLPGFSAGECLPLSEDTSRYTQCRLPIASVRQLAGQTVRLKFYLENARIFAFSFDA